MSSVIGLAGLFSSGTIFTDITQVDRGRRLTNFQLCAVLFDLMEQLAIRNLKVADPEIKLKSAIQHVFQHLESLPADSRDSTNKLVLSTMGLLLDQCMMLEAANSFYHKQIVEWRIATRQLDQPKIDLRLVKTIHNFIVFGLHLNLIYPHNALTAQGVEFAITQAVAVGAPEAENAAKRMVAALITSKALWQMEHLSGCDIAISPPEHLPMKVVDYLRAFYSKFLPLKFQSNSHRECDGPVPFDKVLDWYLKSTRFVKPKNLPPVQQPIKAIVDQFFPKARTSQ
ncbi:hypothetical protein K440DRAFT_660174 [Wilcoxina mikolae CBS 423.85]|nr:hypothetical protein K440DRAFT_660174 [Wilcoxina mikolae CBS 423.85]